MAVERWSPFREMTSLREMMDRFMEDAFISPRRFFEREGWLGVDLYEQDDGYRLDVPLPGARPDDVDVSVVGNTVTVSGRIPCPATAEGARPMMHERSCGEFRRSVTLPSGVDADKTEASFEHGLLRLTIPKSAAARPRRIEVKPAGGESDGRRAMQAGTGSA